MAPEQRPYLRERETAVGRQGCASAPIVLYTRAEWRAARALGADYRRLCWRLSAPELDRLRFVRWLVDHGRLAG